MEQREAGPRVTVVGPGAVGSVVAVALVRAGALVFLVSRGASGCEEKLLSVEGMGSARLVLCGWDAAPREPGIVVYATKAYQLPAALEQGMRLGWSPYPAVSLQNGLYSLEAVEAVHAEAAAGVVFLGATRGPRGVKLTAPGKLVLGCHRPPCGRWLRVLALLLSQGGVEAVEAGWVEPWRWLKLAVNAAVNPVTVFAWAPNRVVAEDPAARSLAEQLAGEAAETARLAGVPLPRDPVAEAVRVAEATGENCSSMLQDVSAGRPTEIDYINGAVVAEARRMGVEAPRNEAVAAAVKLLAPRLAGRPLPCSLG